MNSIFSSMEIFWSSINLHVQYISKEDNMVSCKWRRSVVWSCRWRLWESCVNCVSQ